MEYFSYGFSRTVSLDFNSALTRASAALKEQGFDLLTRIDAQAEFRAHLHLEFRRYLILGICNTLVAHKLLSTDGRIGLLLPCNIVLAEANDGRTVIMAFDPTTLSAATHDLSLHDILEQVRERLETALSRI